MPSAIELHAAYAALEKRANADAMAARKQALADWQFVATATRARRAKEKLAPLVGEETERRVALQERQITEFLAGLDEAA